MSLNPTTLLASSAQFLTEAGYRQVTSEAAAWHTADSRLFEDAYSLVSVVVYATWGELVTAWPDAQARLVETMATRLSKTESKAWDGYVVLLTPGYSEPSSGGTVSSIRYNTTRVRKLVAAGEDLQALEDVRRAILPLLPVAQIDLEPTRDMLTVLKEALAKRGIDREDAEQAIVAFSRDEPILPALCRGSDAS